MGAVGSTTVAEGACRDCGVEPAPGQAFARERTLFSGPSPRCPDCFSKRQRRAARAEIVASLALCALFAWAAWGKPDELGYRLPFLVAVFLLALPLTILPHELGHALMARLLGVGVTSIHVGRGVPWLELRIAGIETQFHAIPSGGHAFLGDEYGRSPRWRRAAILAAGPAVNVVLGAAVWSAATWRSSHGDWLSGQALLAVAGANAFVALMNLVPFTEITAMGTWPSDGMALLDLAFPGRGPRLPGEVPLGRPSRNARALRLVAIVICGCTALMSLFLAVVIARGAQGDAPWSVVGLLAAMSAFAGWFALRLVRAGRSMAGPSDAGPADPESALAMRCVAETNRLPAWPDGTPASGTPPDIARALEAGELERAVDLVAAMLSDEPANARALLVRAELLRRLGRDDEARDAYAAFLRLPPPGDALVLVATAHLVTLQLRAGRIDEARELVARHVGASDALADKLQVLDVAACVSLIEALPDLFELSLQWIDQALALEPRKLTLLGTRGALLVELGRMDEGEPLLASVLEGSASSADQGISVAYLAICAWRRGDTRSAARLARRARLLEPAAWIATRLERAERETLAGAG